MSVALELPFETGRQTFAVPMVPALIALVIAIVAVAVAILAIVPALVIVPVLGLQPSEC